MDGFDTTKKTIAPYAIIAAAKAGEIDAQYDAEPALHIAGGTLLILRFHFISPFSFRVFACEPRFDLCIASQRYLSMLGTHLAILNIS